MALKRSLEAHLEHFQVQRQVQLQLHVQLKAKSKIDAHMKFTASNIYLLNIDTHIPLSSETPTFDANLCRHTTLTGLPWGVEMVCFTTLGEHDALKSDKPACLKVTSTTLKRNTHF